MRPLKPRHLTWYRRTFLDALEADACLSLEERGAFTTVLDLIYSRSGKIDADDRFIAGWLRVDVRVWRRIQERLIACDKLYRDGNTLRNRRADEEVDYALRIIEANRQAGILSAKVRRHGNLMLVSTNEAPRARKKHKKSETA